MGGGGSGAGLGGDIAPGWRVSLDGEGGRVYIHPTGEIL